ncbi:MAG: ribbon-helix-helix protein, CopG family [Candidatus Diapherotrites archaeon]|nr:ribbon-helix-helix protein, CopG family [Candidatus Diapherotrites archaeon]
METVQVRLNKELARLLKAAVSRGVYPNKSEVIRDALRRLFAPELKEEILAEALRRGKSKEFVSQKEIEKEFGL